MQGGEERQMGWSAKKRGKGGETVIAADGDRKKLSWDERMRGKEGGEDSWKKEKEEEGKERNEENHFVMVKHCDIVLKKCETEA